MNIQVENCSISNSQIGNKNIMVNETQKVDWKKWNLVCQELKQQLKNKEQVIVVIKLEEILKDKNETSLKQFVKKHYPDFFSSILSGIISSNLSDLIKNLWIK